jgi:hypothetical protein
MSGDFSPNLLELYVKDAKIANGMILAEWVIRSCNPKSR